MIRAALITGPILLALALWLGRQPAFALDPAGNPRLTSLEVDIWPEFDRPAALIILHGQIAPDVTLPVATSLRIPTSAGGPAAVATQTTATSSLLNLDYQRSDIQVDFTTVTFTSPNRFFQVEYYEPMKTDAASRHYRYLWPGDFAVGQLTVQLQQPAGASAITVQPDLGDAVTGNDGMSYRQKDLGPYDAGKPLTVDIQYQKSDSRTSSDILGFNKQSSPAPASNSGGGGLPLWVVMVVGIAAIAIFLAAITAWRLRLGPYARQEQPSTRAERRRQLAGGHQAACRQCGNPLRAGDRFCGACGRAVRTRR